MKEFKKDLQNILELIKNKTPFAFNRFSDGEIAILQNKKLILSNSETTIGNELFHGTIYCKEDWKDFNPEKHQFFRQKLTEAFTDSMHNYFKGISCICCVGEERFEWQKNILNTVGGNDEFLTWANLFVNSNYSFFIEQVWPHIENQGFVLICNEAANLENLKNLKKDFRVGYNAMINDYGKIDEIKKWIKEENIQNTIFLFSASAFSKVAIHQLYKEYPTNTFLDVGTTLNKFIGMRLDRGYLKGYWYRKSEVFHERTCVWKNI